MYRLFPLLLLILAAMSGCAKEKEQGLRPLKVAATEVPHAQMLAYIKPDLAQKGIDLQIIIVNDYNLPNKYLAEKEIDANFFQTIPFLVQQTVEYHYPIRSIAQVYIEPMGIYSKKIKSFADLPEKAIVAIPNDPTNRARALSLLQQAGIIEMTNPYNILANLPDITANPKGIIFQQEDAELLYFSLPDVDAAALNTNFALQYGLDPSCDALIVEQNPLAYVNVIAVHLGDASRSDLQELATAMTSPKMRQFILSKYKGALIPIF